MLLSSLNTGSTDLRDTEVQQPSTAATLSLVMSSRAVSANSGQLEAGSTTTASSFVPSNPSFLFCSSISISITSLSVVSLMAMVPDNECRMPTLMVSCALAGSRAKAIESRAVAASQRRAIGRSATAWILLSMKEIPRFDASLARTTDRGGARWLEDGKGCASVGSGRNGLKRLPDSQGTRRSAYLSGTLDCSVFRLTRGLWAACKEGPGERFFRRGPNRPPAER